MKNLHYGTTVYCDKCNKDFDIELEKQNRNGIVRTYFKCKYCSTEYDVMFKTVAEDLMNNQLYTKGQVEARKQKYYLNS